MSIFMSGETASGKTTTLNSMLTFINYHSKIFTAEDTPEVIVPQPVWQRLITRESGSGDSRVELFDLVRAALRSRPDYIIVGEATEGRIAIGQRGRAEVLVSAFGYEKHASVGRSTVNPIEQVAYIIDTFHRWYCSDAIDLLGKRNIVPTDIKIPLGGGGGLDSRGGNSTVPNRVELTYDVRTLPGDTPESIMRLMRGNLERVIVNGRKRYPDFKEPSIEFARDECKTYTGVSIAQEKFAPAWYTEENAAIVELAKKGLAQAGQKPVLGSYSFCTDGSAIDTYRRLTPDVPCEIIGYGPSNEGLAHTVNEYIELAALRAAVNGYAHIVSELLRLR